MICYWLLGLVYLTFNWENSPDYALFDDHDEILHEIVSFIDMSLRCCTTFFDAVTTLSDMVLAYYCLVYRVLVAVL